MAAIGEPYASLSQLKVWLTIPDEDDADDTKLTQALASASRGVTRFCRRQFHRAEEASPRRYRPISAALLHVHDFYTLEELTIGGTAFDEAVWQLAPEDGIRDGEPGWPWWKIRGAFTPGQRVEVRARWGWEQVPDPVQESTLITAAEIFKLKDAPFGVAGSDDFGLIRVRDNHRVTTMLAPYRRTGVRIA